MSRLSVVDVVHGQADEPVDVGPDHAHLRRGRGDPAHPVDLLEGAGAHLVGHPRRLDLLAQLVDLGLLRVVLAQLPLDRLELFAEDVLPLGLVHLGLDLALDLPLELEDLDLAGEERRAELEALHDVHGLEQLLALLRRHVRAVGDHVGQQPRLGDVPGGHRSLWRDGRAGLDVLLDLALDRLHERFDLDAGRRDVRQLFDPGEKVGAGLREPVEPEPPLPLDDGPHRPVLELDHLGDLGQGADLVELGRVRRSPPARHGAA